jgi:hypothetical protein
MGFTKADMKYNYKWTTINGDNPKVSGEPDSTLLSRAEGYEMLYFINKCGENWKWYGNDKNAYRKLEKMIQTIVPSTIRSQSGIKQWIEQNHEAYWTTL